jgi:anti-sigma B factor antagonist
MLDPIQRNAVQAAAFRVPSDIDSATTHALESQILTRLRDHGPGLTLDLGEVQFIDSAGLGMLLTILREARHAGGTVRLVNAQREVLRLLQITGLERVFEIG